MSYVGIRRLRSCTQMRGDCDGFLLNDGQRWQGKKRMRDDAILGELWYLKNGGGEWSGGEREKVVGERE